MSEILAKDIYGGGKEVDLLLQQLVSIEAEMNKIVASGQQLTKVLSGAKGSTPQGQSQIKQAANDAERLTSAMERLKVVQSGTEQKLIQVKQATAALNREQQAQAKLANSAKGSYDALSASMALNIIKLHQMENGLNKNNKEAQSLTRTIAAQRAELKSHDAQTGQFGRNVGNYFNGILKSVVALGTAYLSVTGIQNLISGIFTQTKALDSLNTSFNQVLGSILAVKEAQSFLGELAKNTGSDIFDLSNQYLKFVVITKDAGISQDRTNKVFETFTKISAVLGTGTQGLNATFESLDKIIGKGEVSARAFLGLSENIPGAFYIGAAAIGVTTAEFKKLLAEGKIASDDFLPKFAKQAELAFGTTNLKRIDNLAAAQGRFKDAITDVVRKLDASDAFKTLFNDLTKLFTVIGDNIDLIINLGKSVLIITGAWVAWKTALAATNLLQFIGITQTVTQTLANEALAAATEEATIAQSGFNIAIKDNPVGFIAAALITVIGLLHQYVGNANDAKEATDKLSKAQSDAHAEIETTRTKVGFLVKVYGDEKTSLQDKKAILEEINRIMPGYLGDIDKNKVSVEQLTTATNNYLTSLEKTLTAKTLENDLGDVIKQREDLINRLNTGDFVKNTRGLPGALLADKLFGTTQTSEGIFRQLDVLNTKIRYFKDQIEKIGPILSTDNTITPPKNQGSTGTPDKTLLDSIQKLKELNALESDARIKELRDNEIFLLEKTDLFKKNGLDLIALENYVQSKREEINNKYDQIDNKNTQFQADQRKSFYKQLTDAIIKFAHIRADDAAKNRKEIIEEKNLDFDANQEQAKKLFEFSKHSTLEAKRFDIQQEIEKLAFKLELNKNFGNQLTEQQVSDALELKKALEDQLSGLKEPKKVPQDLFDLFGINISDEAKQQLTSAFDFAKSELQSFFDLQSKLTDQAVADADRRVQASEAALQAEISDQRAGYADRVEAAEAQLRLDKKNQQEQLKLRQKQQKDELIINKIMEASNLAVAISKALALNPILAAVVIGTLLTSFALGTAKAFSLVNKQTFRKGTYQTIGGGSHESGNDTFIGNVNGGPGFAEKNESVGVFTAAATRRYKPALKDFVNAANKLELEKVFNLNANAAKNIPFINVSIKTGVMETRLGQLVKQGEKQSGVDQHGRYYTIINGAKKIYS